MQSSTARVPHIDLISPENRGGGGGGGGGRNSEQGVTARQYSKNNSTDNSLQMF